MKRAVRLGLHLCLVLLATTPAWGDLALDVVRSTDRSASGNSITTPSFSTASASELLLIFVATDAKSAGVTVTGVTGAGLNWALVKRSNAQLGTAEIWGALASARLASVSVRASLSQSVGASITVVSFTGADPSGAIGNTAGASAASGAPSASVVTGRNSSWVLGVGNDWDNAIGRTVGANQMLVHQFLSAVGDTYWVQQQNNSTALAGTQVFINDTAPTTDRYNLSIVEVLAAPSSAGSLSLSGNISPTNSGVGTLVTLKGTATAAVTADPLGNYNFPGLTNGTYTVTPSKSGFTFNPTNHIVTINGTSVSGINFTITPVPTWSISGTVSPGPAGSGTLLTLSGTPSATTTADPSGLYSFMGLPNGNFTVTPSKPAYTFAPVNQAVTINGANVVGVNFTAQALPPSLTNYPDLSDIIPEGAISIVGSGANRVFQYTHDTLNGGPGPLAIQPVYNPASGNYQGYQQIYSHQSGAWTVVQTIPVAGAFIFDAAHGHFHFPFAAYGLYAANPDGSIGAAVALSTKTGFCIDDSFLYDSSLPNAGALGNLGLYGSCADPTTLRGLSIGAVDEYDQTDEGQSIAIGSLTNGTYWLRAMVDPYNYLAEFDKSNNETDVKVGISGSTVTVLQTVKPVLPPPPAISLTSPGAGTVSGPVLLTASTAVNGVQFLVDGLAFGNVLSGPPYNLVWDTTTVPAGAHWLAAQTADPTQPIGTSPVIFVNVTNLSTVPPTVQVIDPEPGATVSAVITLNATAAAQVGVPSVQFLVDGVPLGSPVAAPPYMTTWDTELAAAGAHILGATVTDQSGLTGSSAPVSVTVDNSHPANLIGIDMTVFQDSSSTMQTPAFSTRTASDLLVAFVGYDGPTTAAQTATVSGAGLPWLLAKRSNTQHGTSEIWVAKATDYLSSVTVISQPGFAGYHGSLTVVAFTNAAGAGTVGQASAPSGAPDIYLPGVFAGNWVFAVGNDWDNAIGRTPVSGQALIHQRVDTQTGDTYWVQAPTAPSTADALVDIHDSAPTTDQWNYAAVEVVATRQ